MAMATTDERPSCFCGAGMIYKGQGREFYPYECPARNIHPDAVIWEGCDAGHMGWLHTRPGAYIGDGVAA